MMDAKQALSGAHLSAHSVKLAETAWSNWTRALSPSLLSLTRWSWRLSRLRRCRRVLAVSDHSLPRRRHQNTLLIRLYLLTEGIMLGCSITSSCTLTRSARVSTRWVLPLRRAWPFPSARRACLAPHGDLGSLAWAASRCSSSMT
jgi:hypothetical protein